MNELNELETEETMEDQDFTSLPDVETYEESSDVKSSNLKGYVSAGLVGSMLTIGGIEFKKHVWPKAKKAVKNLATKVKSKKKSKDVIDAEVVEETEED